MEKTFELSSYSVRDEFHGDCMIYEIKYKDGRKEYISRELFRYLKALQIIKEKLVNIDYLIKSNDLHDYNNYIVKHGFSTLTQEEYNLLKEVLL